MYKINQSLVDQMRSNKSIVVITPKIIPMPCEETEEFEDTDTGELSIDPRAEAERIIQDARIKAEKIKQSAWEEGYNKGKADAETEINDFMEAQSREVSAIFSSLQKYREELYYELQDNVLQLSFDIAEKIVNTELQKDDKVYIGIVKKAIQDLKGVDKFVLHVGRAEYERFFKEGTQWLRDETGSVPFEVVCDPQMGEGGCILESDDTTINAGIKLQLESLRHVLDEKAQIHGKVL